jgi:uncharacterized protein
MNRVVHFEFSGQVPERQAEFYKRVFGWKLERFPGPKEYWLAEAGKAEWPGINGGILRHDDGAARTVNTIGVDSIEDAVKKVEAAGGKVVVPKFAIPTVGWQVYCTDTEGLIFGLHQFDEAAA